ncbi:MAG: hypothetical protein KIT27_12110 [Legionellales bacterium]|nr:hypothetical protein [Legionellales bacterium]
MEDYRALNILFHSHLNPYGLFPLDLTKQLPLVSVTLNNKNFTDRVMDFSHLTEISKELEVVV